MASTENYSEGNFSDVMLEEEDLVEAMVSKINWLMKTSEALSLIIYSVGFFVNIIVCLILARRMKPWTSLNLFFVILSLNDITRIVFAVLILSTRMIYDHWILGSALCHFIVFHITFVIWFDAFLILAIFIIFMYLKTPSIKTSCCIILTVLNMALIVAYINGRDALMYKDHRDKFECGRYPANNNLIHFRVLFPFFLISLYWLQVLYENFFVRAANHVSKNLIRLLLLLLLTYGVNLLPRFILHVLEHQFEMHYTHSINNFAGLPVRANVLIRPILYYFYLQEFKQNLQEMLPKCFQWSSRNNGNFVMFSDID